MPERSSHDLLVKEIFPALPASIRGLLADLPSEIVNALEEIRIRQARPLMLVTHRGDYLVSTEGGIAHSLRHAYYVSQEDTRKTLQLMSDSSLYALEEELRNGYLTLRGGHRVGLVGRVVMDKGKVKTMKHIVGFNIRISREILGVADSIMPYIILPPYDVMHTLLISPPQCGKTTLLRDIVRQLSDGVPSLGFYGVKVGVVDERSEIAGCFEGVPQNNVGIRTDVLDACPKAEGMMMLLRAMSPQVIATDEIGRREDVEAMEEALNAGVKLITTVHGRNLDDLNKRPILQELLRQKMFDRLVILGRSRGIGTVEEIIDGKTMLVMVRNVSIRSKSSEGGTQGCGSNLQAV